MSSGTQVTVTGVGGIGTIHTGAVIESISVVTVPEKARAFPIHVTFAPAVIPASSISVPINDEFAASVVACIGVQKTSQAEAPPERVTDELATVVNAPVILKI